MSDQSGLRKAFDDRLETIDGQIVQMFVLVTEAVAAASDALLRGGDRESARVVVRQDAAIDRIEHGIEELVQHELFSQSPMASDLRFLLSAVRVAPELERSGDLAAHIASRAADDLGDRIPPTVRADLEEMASTCVRMWHAARQAWSERDVEAAERLDLDDDRIDSLHDHLVEELCRAEVALDDALQTTLVARFYERLGDHAVHITERLAYLTGT
jgi:phosphate transport system protein